MEGSGGKRNRGRTAFVVPLLQEVGTTCAGRETQPSVVRASQLPEALGAYVEALNASIIAEYEAAPHVPLASRGQVVQGPGFHLGEGRLLRLKGCEYDSHAFDNYWEWMRGSGRVCPGGTCPDRAAYRSAWTKFEGLSEYQAIPTFEPCESPPWPTHAHTCRACSTAFFRGPGLLVPGA